MTVDLVINNFMDLPMLHEFPFRSVRHAEEIYLYFLIIRIFQQEHCIIKILQLHAANTQKKYIFLQKNF